VSHSMMQPTRRALRLAPTANYLRARATRTPRHARPAERSRTAHRPRPQTRACPAEPVLLPTARTTLRSRQPFNSLVPCALLAHLVVIVYARSYPPQYAPFSALACKED